MSDVLLHNLLLFHFVYLGHGVGGTAFNPASQPRSIHHLCNQQAHERGAFARQTALVAVGHSARQGPVHPQAVCVVPLGDVHVSAAVLVLLASTIASLIVFSTFT